MNVGCFVVPVGEDTGERGEGVVTGGAVGGEDVRVWVSPGGKVFDFEEVVWGLISFYACIALFFLF